jgi:hypothetical protein
MENILKKPLFWFVAVLTLFNVGIFVVGKVVIDKAADAVIHKLQKEYSPSPYGPGLDPDRVDVNSIKQQRLYMELARRGDSASFKEDFVQLQQSQSSSDLWLTEWEADRGFGTVQRKSD